MRRLLEININTCNAYCCLSPEAGVCTLIHHPYEHVLSPPQQAPAVAAEVVHRALAPARNAEVLSRPLRPCFFRKAFYGDGLLARTRTQTADI